MSQVIKKRRIVLASLLKPVDDTRMFEKIAMTLVNGGEFEVSIIGYPSTESSARPEIKFYPLPAFKRLSLKRLLAPWLVLKKINQVKPELVIINTPELLIVAIFNKIFFGCRIVYDVLENYYKNIRHTPTFPSWLRPLLSVAVRFVEMITSPLVDQFLLAEKGYNEELSFARPHIILQNKLPKSIASKYRTKRANGNSRLIFSGTLALSSGVFEAIRLCKGLHQVDNSYSLSIIGYCALPGVLSAIRNSIIDAPYITLIGGDSLVPHENILEEISLADFGIIIYPTNPSTQGSLPTKLYEYLALQLPILIRHNAESHQLVKECKAGIILSEAPDYAALSSELKATRFTPTIPDSVFWDSEEENLINCLKLI